jgi:hypothetical protein
MTMFIKTALILCEDRKTDDELKTIMATHPWAPALMHGFYKSFGGTWEEYADRGGGDPDAIWCGGGITAYNRDRDDKWIVESFDTPHLLCRPLSTDPLCAYERRKGQLEDNWWMATVELIRHQVPAEYRVYVIYYGEIVDEFDNAEEAWREGLLAIFNYAPKVAAALGLEVRP